MIEWIENNILSAIAAAGSTIAAVAALQGVRLSKRQLKNQMAASEDQNIPLIHARKGGFIDGWSWVVFTVQTKAIGARVEIVKGSPNALMVKFPHSEISTFGIKGVYKRADFSQATASVNLMREIAANQTMLFCFWYQRPMPPSRSNLLTRFRKRDMSNSVSVSLSLRDRLSRKIEMVVAIDATVSEISAMEKKK